MCFFTIVSKLYEDVVATLGIFYSRVPGAEPSLQTSNSKAQIVHGRVGMFI